MEKEGVGRPRKTWKDQVEAEMERAGFEERRCPRSCKMAESTKIFCAHNVNPATLVYGENTGLKLETHTYLKY